MILFNDIMLRIKTIIATSKSNQRIYNKDIAKELKLTPEYFAVIKKRGKIPYKSIAIFCKDRGVSINWVLFGQGQMTILHNS
jgi:hypothetical protein